MSDEQIDDSGFYVRKTATASTPEAMRALFGRINANTSEAMDIDRALIAVVELADQTIKNSKPSSPAVADAQEVKGRARRLETLLKAADNPRAVAMAALLLGRAYERMILRPHEPAVRGMRKTLGSMRAANVKKHGDPREKAARFAEAYRHEVAAGAKIDTAVEAAALAAGIGKRTGYRYLKKLAQ